MTSKHTVALRVAAEMRSRRPGHRITGVDALDEAHQSHPGARIDELDAEIGSESPAEHSGVDSESASQGARGLFVHMIDGSEEFPRYDVSSAGSWKSPFEEAPDGAFMRIGAGDVVKQVEILLQEGSLAIGDAQGRRRCRERAHRESCCEFRCGGGDEEIQVARAIEQDVVLGGFQEKDVAGSHQYLVCSDSHLRPTAENDVDLGLGMEVARTPICRLVPPDLRATAAQHREGLKKRLRHALDHAT